MNLKKSCFTEFMSCISFILSTFVSFPFVVPFQHCCNVICAVILGPVYGFVSALITGCMRMLLTGRPVTAIIGASTGAWYGTRPISALLSYYVMKYGFGVTLSTPLYYIPLFMPACITGAFLGYAILVLLKRSGSLSKIREMLK